MDRFDDAQDQGPMPGGPGGAAPIVVDIPGIGVRSFDPKLGLPQIQENIRILQQEQRMSAVSARGTGFNGDVAHERLKNMMLNPELVAGAASMVPAVGTLAAGGIGAATSVARDAATGHLDPIGSTARALGHGAVNMIPGGAEALIAKRAIPRAAEVAGNIATSGVKGGLLGTLKSILTGSEAAAPGVVRAGANAAGDLAGMELPGGIAVVSNEGIAALKKAQVAIANRGKAFGDAQFDALDELIRRATDQLAKSGSGLPTLAAASKTGVTTAAERRAMQAAAAKAAAEDKGATIASRLRKLLTGTSETADALGVGGR